MNAIKPVKQLAIIRHELENNAVELVMNDAVKEMMEIKSQFETEFKATWKALETYMLSNDIKDIYNLTIAERKSWKVEGQLPPRFYKQVVDTSELAHLFDKGKKLPKGASFSITKYLTKTNRKVAA